MRHGVLLATTAVVAGSAALLACNAILDFGAYSTAPAADAGDDAGGECATNQDCIARPEFGDFSICRKRDLKCAKLVTPECPTLLGDWRSDDAVLLGAISPLLGADAPSGIPLQNAIALAVDEFRQGANGLPPVSEGRRRPIAVVSCSESTEDPNDEDVPQRSARHLVDVVGVPAIIGAAFSGNTQRAAQVTIPGGVLLMSPSATSVAITDLADDGLVWRTSPSDVIQSAAMVALMPQIEALTRKRVTPEITDLRVWLVHKGDSYGKGLGEALTTSLRFNNKRALDNGANYKVIDYGDPDSNQPPPDYASVLQQTNAAIGSGQAPHVIILIGTNESIVELMTPLEALSWPAGTRPTYLLGDGGAVPELSSSVGTNADLRKRIFGTIPGTDNETNGVFRQRYAAGIKDGTSPDVSGTANAYDALYLIAYALAAQGDKPVTGATIAEGLRRLVPPGRLVRPGATQINAAFSALASGQNIDYDGASGPLDFNLDVGEADSDIQIWCVPEVGGVAGPATPAGVIYQAARRAIGEKQLEPPHPDVTATCGL